MRFIYKNVYLEYDSDKEVFFHPMTGQPCEMVSQCFFGWSEQDREIAKEWQKLEELIMAGFNGEYPQGIDVLEFVRDDVDVIFGEEK